ncbi:hypothetical protein E2553_42350 [Paraburkholderia dipogonis]|uniref:O-antigen ligase domain-containing protein n=1 Tax=Paraburkholderia dipogonis TaxID=1211383 RepID=A0A4Y8MG29_9BURK|nr:hypothetical protein [Paraburkholderia dipogonis]TFE36409.1 hypothetical protein E2553_42350 [Paraburkholderia dipogonis]
MYRLIYVAPFIVAIVNTFGYAQIQVSSTSLLVFALCIFMFLDARDALRSGRLLFRLGNPIVMLTICLLTIAGVAAAIAVANGENYDGPGGVYVVITPYIMFFPCAWVAVTQRVDKQHMIKALGTTVNLALKADIVVSLLQVAYLTFIDPSGYIFTANQRLNSVAQFDDIRLVGLFASGLDHGFFLTIAALLIWVLAAENLYSKRRFFISLWVISILVYFTYTRTAYIIYLIAFAVMMGSQVARRFGMTGLIVILFFMAIVAGITFEAIDASRSVSGMVQSKSLLNLQTLQSRYGSWDYYESFLVQRPEVLLFGNALLQSAFPFIKSPPPLIDNLYLSLVLYGGVAYLLVYSTYMAYFAGSFFWAFKRRHLPEFDRRLYLTLAVSVVVVAIVGFSATVWDLLSIGLPTTVLWALGWSYRRESRRLHPRWDLT